MPTINECPTIFCGCQSIHSDNSIQNQSEQQLEMSYKVYLYILFIVVVVMLCTKLSLNWFIYKDYYPLKQKSPILTIVMGFSICLQIILYPLVYVSNYFTYVFVDPKARAYFRSIQVALQFSVYSIYFLRCTRISYAHETDKSRRKSVAFWIFQRESLLAIIVMLVAALRGVCVIVDPCISQKQAFCTDFAFGFQIASVNYENATEQYFMMRSLIMTFFWQMLLVFCVWQHRNVNYRYSMKFQMGLILACIQITSLIHILTIVTSINNQQYSIMLYLCSISTIYPMTQFLKLLNLLAAFIVSIIVPLFQTKVYHVLLPTGPHYGFVKTMRNFLMEKEFLRVFSAYLKYLDEDEQTDCYSKLLKFWQKMILLKISNGKQTQQQKLDSIITTVQDIQQSRLFSQHNQLLNSLKGTITGLQDSQIQQNPDSHSQQPPPLLQSIEQIRRQKYRSSINDRVDELQEIALQKLNKIYSQKYCETESYHNLRQIMNEYKKVNLNLIMLNMALIVDHDNQFS